MKLKIRTFVFVAGLPLKLARPGCKIAIPRVVLEVWKNG